MSDAISFLLILPVLVLGVAVLDAAGTLGTAHYRTSTFTEAAATSAADALTQSPPAPATPLGRARWPEVASAVERTGLAATVGVCDQTDPAFDISLIPQSLNAPGQSQSVAAVVSCPVRLSRLFTTDRVVAVGVEPVG